MSRLDIAESVGLLVVLSSLIGSVFYIPLYLNITNVAVASLLGFTAYRRKIKTYVFFNLSIVVANVIGVCYA